MIILKKQTLIYIFILFCFAHTMMSQGNPSFISKPNKGRFYVYWGWNQDAYSTSNIHFLGQNYDFTLKSVLADDKPSPFSLKTYFHPSIITIPQYNYRLGYFLKENWSMSLGMDHMKYVVRPGQTVAIDGDIHDSQTKYDGSYHDENIVIEKGFLEFEHTDGLNYANFDLRKHFPLFKYGKL